MGKSIYRFVMSAERIPTRVETRSVRVNPLRCTLRRRDRARHLLVMLVMLVMTVAGCDSRPKTPTPEPERPILTASPRPGAAYVAVIGDLYTIGSPSAGEGSKGWPSVAKRALRQEGVNIELNIGARRGSGYAWHNTPMSVVFIDQVRQTAGMNTKLVILFGSESDQGNPPGQLTPIVQSTLAEARKKAPDAKLLVIGPAWAQPNPPPGVLQARDVVRTEAESFGAMFVDPLAEDWFVGKPELLAPGGDRPNDAGHQFMAERIAPLIAQLLGNSSTR
ncbi:SGNH/GDSL hydrolase family protein [Mycolicibacterium fluoranthenivorans]|uniref:SGNH/GDSL hydrolase family protein n=1 Tax=Mycolicibacterium fluoranthenivorans TaxID=258505 RepID=A0A7G8PHI9_9MYCO|nr:SGNH/GDSL hydrolase family protein [Mycolicibacterium fluoranthenivorans]QNJ93805.1 SGNH/GDSL hydrolase family protein [Mycolicibacterium fluoranthenivorans]